MGAYDAFRTKLNIRQQRKRPRGWLKPAPGARIVLEDFRIVVQPGLSDALWNFLAQGGFREVAYRPDRRGYRDVPPALVANLYNASPDDWQALLIAALQEASRRPRIRFLTRSARVNT